MGSPVRSSLIFPQLQLPIGMLMEKGVAMKKLTIGLNRIVYVRTLVA